jgi:hypothetical protein
VPHRRRVLGLSGEHLRTEPTERSADGRLTEELNDLAGQTLDDLEVEDAGLLNMSVFLAARSRSSHNETS